MYKSPYLNHTWILLVVTASDVERGVKLDLAATGMKYCSITISTDSSEILRQKQTQTRFKKVIDRGNRKRCPFYLLYFVLLLVIYPTQIISLTEELFLIIVSWIPTNTSRIFQNKHFFQNHLHDQPSIDTLSI